MKRFLFLMLMLAGMYLLLTGIPVFAASSTLNATLTRSNLLPNGRLTDDTTACNSLTSSGKYYYAVVTFHVTASGDYDYADAHYTLKTKDTWIAFYASGFDPADPLGNGCFANFDDSGTVHLTAGVSYTLMFSNFNSNTTGSVAAEFTGPGDVVEGRVNILRESGQRINPQIAAPIVLYCKGTINHGLTVYGQVLFDVENGRSAGGVWGSILPTADGRMLLTAAFPDGKPYYFLYDGCAHGSYQAFSGNPAVQFDTGGY